MSWYQKVLYGVDLDEEQAKQNELDAQLKKMNDDALAAGKWDNATYQAAEQHRVDSQINDVQGEVDKAFNSGLQDGIDNIRGGIGKTINFPFRLIPWQVYVIGAVFLFFYMGGAELLRGSLTRFKK